MKSLDNLVSEVNEVILAKISGTHHSEGICRIATRGTERVIYNEKNQQVLFDDKYNHYFYHLLIGESTEKIQAGGKKALYNITATIELVCFSSLRNFDDYIKSKLSLIRDAKIEDINYNSLDLFKREVGDVDKFNLSKYLFSVKYQLVYKSDSCYIDSCDEC